VVEQQAAQTKHTGNNNRCLLKDVNVRFFRVFSYCGVCLEGRESFRPGFGPRMTAYFPAVLGDPLYFCLGSPFS